MTPIRQWRTLDVHFIETPGFTRLISRHLDDDAYRALQVALILRPEQGPLIPHSGGLRKVRWGIGAMGKRGGLRIIYSWEARLAKFYLLFVYPKHAQGDLTAAQLRTLRRTVMEELRETEGL